MEAFADGSRADEPPPARRSVLALMDKIPALLWLTDRQPNFVFLTGGALHNTDFSATDFTGKPIVSLFDPSRQNEVSIWAHKKALEGIGGKFKMEWNGRNFEAHVEPILEQDGTVAGAIGIALDVTARVVAETALRLSEQSYRSLVEEAPYGICRATESGQLLQVNRAMLEMLGYDSGFEADLLVRDLPVIFGTPECFYSWRNQLLSGQMTQGYEATWICKNGLKIHVRLGGRAVRKRGGEVLFLDILSENITERRELQSRLGQAQKMQAVGQLAGGVAHDFNNLLMVIGGQTELVLEETQDEEIRRRLDHVKQAADRAASLTKQLLAFSRRQVLQSKVVDLNNVIGHAIGMLTRLIRENITFTFNPGQHLGFVRTDPNQIEQVLMNLVVNAQDAMPDGGKLTVETQTVQIEAMEEGTLGTVESGSYVVIAVRDTGIGMDRETQSRIFEPFFTTKEPGEGTGLGLSMVYGVVKQCGGHIRVESQLGKGTSVAVYLPRVDEPAPARFESARSDSPRGSEIILFAEDEESVRELVVTYLKHLGYQVLAASDGSAALEIARTFPHKIDLLLTDLVLPKMGGRELAEELGKLVRQLKVIFVSGYAGHGVVGNALDFPDAYFLSKPFSMHRLAMIIRDVLDGTSTPGS